MNQGPRARDHEPQATDRTGTDQWLSRPQGKQKLSLLPSPAPPRPVPSRPGPVQSAGRCHVINQLQDDAGGRGTTLAVSCEPRSANFAGGWSSWPDVT